MRHQLSCGPLRGCPAHKLRREEELELTRRFRRGGDRAAADTLARAHLGQVVSVALKYRHYGVSPHELFAEGSFGIVQALLKFEPERGVRFSTYAGFWIQAYILEHVIQSWSLVGAGAGALRSRLFFRLRRERARAIALFGEGPAAHAALAERVGIAPAELAKLLQRLDARDVSLEFRVNDSSARLVDLLPSADDQEENLLQGELDAAMKSAVAAALAMLDPRERYIAERRLMADAEDGLSLGEISRTFGVSRERARQLETRTKRKLRASISASESAPVRDWLAASGLQSTT